MLLAAGLLWMNGCKKETAVQQPRTATTIDEAANQTMLEHVLDFKQLRKEGLLLMIR